MSAEAAEVSRQTDDDVAAPIANEPSELPTDDADDRPAGRPTRGWGSGFFDDVVHRATILPLDSRRARLRRRREERAAAREAAAAPDVASPFPADPFPADPFPATAAALSEGQTAGQTAVLDAADAAVPAPRSATTTALATLPDDIDAAGGRLHSVVAELHDHMDRSTRELRAVLDGHRADLAGVVEDLAEVRSWVDAIRVGEDGTSGTALRAVATAAARIGLPSSHVEALRRWVAEGHSATVEARHRGVRHGLGLAAVAYATAAGHRVAVVVPTAPAAEEWRIEILGHVPELAVRVDLGVGAVPLQEEADVVITTTEAADLRASHGEWLDGLADLLIVADLPETVAPSPALDDRFRRRLGLSDVRAEDSPGEPQVRGYVAGSVLTVD